MAGLLGQYETTFSRVNPSMALNQGLMSGFEVGSRYALALRQQRMQEEEQARVQKEREKSSDLQMLKSLGDMYAQAGSSQLKQQIGQSMTDIVAKYNPKFAGQNFVVNDSANKWMSLARKSIKLAGTNFDAGMADLNNVTDEINAEEQKGNLQSKDVEQINKVIGEGKKDLAAQIGGLVQYPEKFNGQPEYSTPEAKAGINQYQRELISQATTLDPVEGARLQSGLDAQQKNENDRGFKTSQFFRGGDGKFYGIGQDKQGNPKLMSVAGSGGMDVLNFNLKPIPAERATALTTGLGNLDRLENINNLFDKTLVGPAQGNIQKAVTIFKNNPNFARFKWNLDEMRTIVYQLSGKQINESEQKWLQGDILPSITNPDQNFKVKLGELTDWLKQKMRDDYDTMENSYYINPRLKKRILHHIENAPTMESNTPSTTSKFKIISVE